MSTNATPVLDHFKDALQHFLTNVGEIGTRRNNKLPQWFSDCMTHLETFGEECVKTVGTLEKQDQLLEAKLAVQEHVIDELVKDRDRLRTEVDDLSQYTRRTNLLFHGIEETDNEKSDDIELDIVNNTMNLGLSLDDISRSHRLGKKVPDRTRPIIARFITYRKRKSVFDAKKKLKGKRVVVTENLTSSRYDLYKKCKDAFDQKNVWTLDGRIYVATGRKLPNNKNERKVISNNEDLANLIREIH